MKFLSEDFAVSAQITVNDIQILKEQGFASVICFRPDSEEQDQPMFHDLMKVAQTAGLVTHHQPVVPNQIAEPDFAEFRKLYAAAPKPILAFCKTGGRAKMLWDRLDG
ncbi:MAG: TIGR01244 family sulfur transferase [Paracoccaceae bacterium]